MVFVDGSWLYYCLEEAFPNAGPVELAQHARKLPTVIREELEKQYKDMRFIISFSSSPSSSSSLTYHFFHSTILFPSSSSIF